MIDDPRDWHKCILCHDSLWELGLSQKALLVYLYLSSFCHKPYAISIIKMAKILHMDTKRAKEAIDELISRSMVTKTNRHGAASLFMVIPRRSKTWGQTPLGVGANAPTHLGANAPTTQGQTPPLTTSLDDTFLSMIQAHIRSWTFNRKPIGSYFVFTRGMQTKAIEMMRWIHKNKPGYYTPEAFDRFLSGCCEYLSHDRDVLSPTKDQRALSPAKWLNDWPEQIRLVGIYLEEKEMNVVRMPPADSQ